MRTVNSVNSEKPNPIEFMDDSLNILFILNIEDLVQYNAISMRKKYNIDKKQDINMNFSVNDNCIVCYEYCDLTIENKHFVEYVGRERIYCYDFTNDKEVIFKNHVMCSNYVEVKEPIRYYGNIKLVKWTSPFYGGGSGYHIQNQSLERYEPDITKECNNIFWELESIKINSSY